MIINFIRARIDRREDLKSDELINVGSRTPLEYLNGGL